MWLATPEPHNVGLRLKQGFNFCVEIRKVELAKEHCLRGAHKSQLYLNVLLSSITSLTMPV